MPKLHAIFFPCTPITTALACSRHEWGTMAKIVDNFVEKNLDGRPEMSVLSNLEFLLHPACCIF